MPSPSLADIETAEEIYNDLQYMYYRSFTLTLLSAIIPLQLSMYCLRSWSYRTSHTHSCDVIHFIVISKIFILEHFILLPRIQILVLMIDQYE